MGRGLAIGSYSRDALSGGTGGAARPEFFPSMWINGILLAMALILTALSVGVFVFATRAGQFEDVEEAKFTMLRSEQGAESTSRRW